jgi:membrane protease YdiL (CAAX protease family)
MMASEHLRRRGPFLVAIVFEGGLVLLAWGIGWVVGESPWANLSWSAGDLGLGILATLPLLAAFALCVKLPGKAFARIRGICNEIIRPFFGACSVIELALISLVAGVAEEMLFRGVIQAALADALGLWPGIVAAGALFGAVHLITPTYGILATLVGIYLGWCYAANGNLLIVIVAHAFYDFLALVYLTRGPEFRVDCSPAQHDGRASFSPED